MIFTPEGFVADWRRRLKDSQNRRQPLARAIGLSGATLHVLDATAGLGRDSILFAIWGCQVLALERSSELCQTLQKALDLAVEVPALKSAVPRIELVKADAREFLRSKKAKGAFDVIYLDPMYSESTKSALAKKEMRDLRELVGDDLDAKELFDYAIQAAPKRVVVKRPDHGKPLAEPVLHQFEGKLVRYDLYLPESFRVS